VGVLADNTQIPAGVVHGLVLEILGRETVCDVLVLPAGTDPLIGQIPLEGCDLIVDPGSGELRRNPKHPPDVRVYEAKTASVSVV
jgi:predicted aspartyl protease